MLKQPAWAAAMSSSGLVPMPFSKRVLNEYWLFLRTPLGVETVPFPSFNPPVQWALPVRCISSSSEIKTAGLKLHDRRDFCPDAEHNRCHRGNYLPAA